MLRNKHAASSHGDHIKVVAVLRISLVAISSFRFRNDACVYTPNNQGGGGEQILKSKLLAAGLRKSGQVTDTSKSRIAKLSGLWAERSMYMSSGTQAQVHKLATANPGMQAISSWARQAKFLGLRSMCPNLNTQAGDSKSWNANY